MSRYPATVALFIVIVSLVYIALYRVVVPEPVACAPVITEAQADELVDRLQERVDFWYGVAEEQGAFSEEEPQ